jgi:hypothetical protein
MPVFQSVLATLSSAWLALMALGGLRRGEMSTTHPTFAKDVGAKHRRLWLVPLHLRERTHRGGALGGLCYPWPPTGGVPGGEGDRQKFLLSKLGKHNIGKSCLYFKKLADLDPSVLEQLVGSAAAADQRRG